MWLPLNKQKLGVCLGIVINVVGYVYRTLKTKKLNQWLGVCMYVYINIYIYNNYSVNFINKYEH